MCEKRKKNKKKKTKKLSQLLKSNISGMPEAISLKFGMWSTEVGGNVHSKIRRVSSRQHRATEVRKLRFLSSCQYTHGVARRLLGPHDTLPCVLIRRAYPRMQPCQANARRVSYCRFVNKPLLFITTNQRSPKVVDPAAQKMYWRSTRPFFLRPHTKRKKAVWARD